MENNDYTNRLENIIKQMLKPLKDIPFNLVIEAMTGKKVISFDFAKSDHQRVLDLLKQAALNAGMEINRTGILRPRPNEVGNDIEPYAKSALNSLGLNADVPTGPKGRKKSTGYPDMAILHITQPKRFSLRAHPNFCFAKTSFMLETLAETVAFSKLKTLETII